MTRSQHFDLLAASTRCPTIYVYYLKLWIQLSHLRLLLSHMWRKHALEIVVLDEKWQWYCRCIYKVCSWNQQWKDTASLTATTLLLLAYPVPFSIEITMLIPNISRKITNKGIPSDARATTSFGLYFAWQMVHVDDSFANRSEQTLQRTCPHRFETISQKFSTSCLFFWEIRRKRVFLHVSFEACVNAFSHDGHV